MSFVLCWVVLYWGGSGRGWLGLGGWVGLGWVVGLAWVWMDRVRVAGSRWVESGCVCLFVCLLVGWLVGGLITSRVGEWVFGWLTSLFICLLVCLTSLVKWSSLACCHFPHTRFCLVFQKHGKANGTDKVRGTFSWIGLFCHFSGSTCGVTVSTSAFLACHQCCCAGSSLAWGLNHRALVCGIFLSSSPWVFSVYSGFLPAFIG